MNCNYCGKPVTLIPSAQERAQRYGGTPEDYTRLFAAHAQCRLKARKITTSGLMTQHRERGSPLR